LSRPCCGHAALGADELQIALIFRRMTDTASVWNRLAGFWDQHLKEGNAFQQKLIMPTTDALLGDVTGKNVLDACCGNGNYARRLAERGARVMAFDGAAAFIDAARARTPANLPVEYQTIDATNAAALAALGESRFDAAVCSMAMMDLPTLSPLLMAIHKALKPGGPFVFSVCHPAFNSPRNKATAELVNEAGRMRQRFGVTTEYYLSAYEELSEGILHQPEPHPMFHRPISALLGDCFAAGFVVDAFEEPAFPFDKTANAFSHAKRPEIPPALVVRVRKAS
jgi:2-polyprenyl-3-methyl-5-hydroxy-6-metoxy-1,4-benzoquinol methylase